MSKLLISQHLNELSRLKQVNGGVRPWAMTDPMRGTSRDCETIRSS